MTPDNIDVETAEILKNINDRIIDVIHTPKLVEVISTKGDK